MSALDQTSRQINTDGSTRHQWISVVAYFKAEARDFEPGKELDDWLEAEIEYTEFQIQAFILRCQEDGDVSINSLQELAKSLGVSNAMQLTTKVELIRLIQKVSHHRPCFQTTYQEPCADTESECQWRKECKKLIAIWYR